LDSLHAFIETAVEKGSTVITDGWKGCNGISEKGYKHKVMNREKKMPNSPMSIR
jgi:hypothetical protein